MYVWDNPPSMSMLDGVNASWPADDDGGVQQSGHVRPAREAEQPADRSCPIWRPSWSWNEEGTELTFTLRQGVKWHDGKPFTAKDVQCTWDLLLGKASDKLRVNPRNPGIATSNEVTTNGDYEVTFHLKRPQPAFLIAARYRVGRRSIPATSRRRDMRPHPIGTGPFKFVEFKPNEVDQGGPKPGLLEEGSALSRRHRILRSSRNIVDAQHWPSSPAIST